MNIKIKLLGSVILGILIDYAVFLLFNNALFPVGSTITIGLCSYIVYSELKK